MNPRYINKKTDGVSNNSSLSITWTEGDERYNLQLAQALYQARQYSLALKLYIDRVHQLTGQDLYVASRNLGNIYVHQGELEEAREFYETALRVCPMSDETRVDHGILEAKSKNFNEALEWLRSAVELNRENDRAWVGLAIIHNEYGDLDLAWANLERALDINPINEPALKLYLEWGRREHRLEAVAQKYEAAIEPCPQNNDLRISLAKIHFELGNLKEAKRHLANSCEPHIPRGSYLASRTKM